MTPRFKKIILLGAVIYSGFFWFGVYPDLVGTPAANAALDWKDRLYDNSHFVRPSGVGNFTNPNLLYTIISPATFLEGTFNGRMAIGDVDGDGKKELILPAYLSNNDQYLYIYNGSTGQLKNSVFVGTSTYGSISSVI